MSQLLQGKRLRLALNAASYNSFTDQLTGQAVQFPISDLRVEVGLFFGRQNSALELVDLANLASLTMTVKAIGAGNSAPAGDAATLMEAVVLAAAMDATLTAETWADFSKQHAVFEFAEAEVNNLDPGSVWVVFTALLTDGKRVPIQFGAMKVVEDGYAGAGTTPVEAGTAYSKAEADTLFIKQDGGIVPHAALTGGSAGALDAIVTADAAVLTGAIAFTLVAGALGIWELTAGTDAEDAAGGKVRPDDYDGATNARVWFRRL